MKASTHTNAPKARQTIKLRKKNRKQEQTVGDNNGTIVQTAAPEPKESVRDMIRDRLYSRIGGEAFHHGNPFAMKFNQALNA